MQSPSRLVHISGKTGAQRFPPCSLPPASHHPACITPNAALIAASCGRRWARLFASITGSSRGQESSSLCSSLSAHSIDSANSLSTLTCALTSLGDVCRKSTSCPLAVAKVVWCGHVLTHLLQAHDNGASRTTDLAPRRLQAHQSLLSSPSLVQIGIVQLLVPDCLCSRHDGFDSARVDRIALVRSQSPLSDLPACLPGKHLPIVVLKAFSLVGGIPMHRTPCKPLGMSPALAIFLVIAPYFW